MVCLCCHTPTRGSLCAGCSAQLRPAPERVLAGGLRVVVAFEHADVARALMHLLKYRGVLVHAEMAAELLAPRVPSLPLAPVPRAWTRRVRYGIDPARAVASALARRLRVPVVEALAPAVHSRRRAGGDHGRGVAPLRVRPGLPSELVVVDDVVTTGATALAAADSLGSDRVRIIAVANAVSKVSSLYTSDQSETR